MILLSQVDPSWWFFSVFSFDLYFSFFFVIILSFINYPHTCLKTFLFFPQLWKSFLSLVFFCHLRTTTIARRVRTPAIPVIVILSVPRLDPATPTPASAPAKEESSGDSVTDVISRLLKWHPLDVRVSGKKRKLNISSSSDNFYSFIYKKD